MERDYSGPTGDDVDPDTDLSYADPFADEDDKDGAYLSPDNDHPPEYYIQQLETFNEEEYVKEDYKKSSTRLLNYMEDQWNQYSASSLGTYWKVFRLVYERATGARLDGKISRSMHKVLRKLTKKHGLKKIGRDKACMYVEDLAQVLQTNLVTTEKRYPHGRYRIQAQLYLQLGGFTANRPQALLSLCYRHIKVTLLRDPEGGPHRVLLEFTFEFTKEFLGVKDLNTFPLPEIMYDETLLFSPHVFLLGLLFYDRAFAAYNLTSPEELSRLTIPQGRNELPLHLNHMLDDVPVFRKATRTVHGWDISPHEPLPYSTLLPWVRTLGEVTGFAQVTRPYSLRYAGGKAFNENGKSCDPVYARYVVHDVVLTCCVGNVSEAMQNLMMGHASISTFLKHYLSRRITVDTQAVVRGIQPQTAFMRAACTMSRSIDLRRPRRLTQEQSASVDEDPSVRFLLDRRDQLKRKVPNATKHPEYKTLVSKISQERQRRRHALLKAVKERWEFEQPVRDVERQLAGLDAIDDSEPIHNIMLPAQEELANSILSKPGTTIEEETDRRNGAIRAVTLYCGIEEGGMYPVQKAGRSRNIALPTKSQLRYDEEALEAAKVSVYKDERPKICFLCLGNERLPLAQRIHSFSTPGDLTKHFGRKHLRNIKSSEGLSCSLCKVFLADKKHLQRHAERIHRTTSPRSSYDCC
ncbi:unnamed protein product [Alternaria burnsii]|nr:unnamed protein product [Alternaria burnsii]